MSVQYISNKFLNWLLNGEALPQINSSKLGLLTVMPNSSGLNYAEPGSGDYQRETVFPANFDTSSAGVVTNSSPIAFAVTTTGWGTIVGVALFDNLGQLLWAGNLAAPLEVPAFKQAQIGVGDIRFIIGECPPVEDGVYREGVKVAEGSPSFYHGGSF